MASALADGGRWSSIQIADITFDRVDYDSDGDVLYLHHGDPSTAVDFDASPGGMLFNSTDAAY